MGHLEDPGIVEARRRREAEDALRRTIEEFDRQAQEEAARRRPAPAAPAPQPERVTPQIAAPLVTPQVTPTAAQPPSGLAPGEAERPPFRQQQFAEQAGGLPLFAGAGDVFSQLGGFFRGLQPFQPAIQPGGFGFTEQIQQQQLQRLAGPREERRFAGRFQAPGVPGEPVLTPGGREAFPVSPFAPPAPTPVSPAGPGTLIQQGIRPEEGLGTGNLTPGQDRFVIGGVGAAVSPDVAQLQQQNWDQNVAIEFGRFFIPGADGRFNLPPYMTEDLLQDVLDIASDPQRAAALATSLDPGFATQSVGAMSNPDLINALNELSRSGGFEREDAVALLEDLGYELLSEDGKVWFNDDALAGALGGLTPLEGIAGVGPPTSFFGGRGRGGGFFSPVTAGLFNWRITA